MARSRGHRPRGEASEMTKVLNHLCTLSGTKPEVVKMKRDCLQKLIRYLTQGIDMSSVFVPVTKCVALSKQDLPLKKMQYLYLRAAARQNRAVALLVVQPLLNDCRDLDPAIRGAALRSMASLRVPELMDSVFMVVEAGLKDPHPYVREAAVVGVLKCWHADRAGTTLRGLMDRVEMLLRGDGDARVVANCLAALRETGRLRVSRELVVALLNHIRGFSDWVQCSVLELVQQYAPASEAERFDILEVLDFGLGHPNSAVAMAAAKLFLSYTAGLPDQAAQVLARVRDALSTTVLGREDEVVHATLCNALVIEQRYPGVFAPLHTDFYCRWQDPSYLKAVKIDMLVAVAEHGNAYDIAEELSQYIRDADEGLARASIAAVAAIALKVPEVNGILDRLLLFLTYDKPYVTAETLVQMVLVLRRYPDAAEACLDAIVEIDPSALEGEEERAAFVWMLGEYGHRIQAAPYILESLVEGFAQEAASVKLALLASLPRLFMRRPPECRPALGRLLAAGVCDSTVAVRGRALFVHGLLAHDAGAAADVLAAPLPGVDAQMGDAAPETRDRIFDELNTLSVVYRAPAASFIKAEAARAGQFDHEEEVEEGSSAPEAATGLLLDLEVGSEASTAPSPRPGSSTPDLMGLGAPVNSGVGPTAAPGGDDGFDLLGAGNLDASPAYMAPSQPTRSGPVPAAQGADAGGLESLLGGFDAPVAAPLASAAAVPPVADVDWLSSLSAGGPTTAASSAHALGDLLGGLGLGNGMPVVESTPSAAGWDELATTAQHARQDLPLGVLGGVQANGFADFGRHVGQAGFAVTSGPAPGTHPPLLFRFRHSDGSLAALSLTAPGVAVHVELEVRGRTSPVALQEHLQTLQHLLLCL